MNRTTLFLPLLLLSGAGCTKQASIPPAQDTPVRTAVYTVASSDLPTGVLLTGTVIARQVANVSAQVMAPVVRVTVKEGDHVQKGELLVELSSAQLKAGVQQADSQVIAAQQQEAAATAQESMAAETLRRYEILNQRHSVTPHEYDQVKSAYEAAQAQKAAAAAQVKAAEAGATQSRANSMYTEIRSPYAGVVTGRYIDPGSLAAPGVPLLRIEDPREQDIEVQMNEASLDTVHPGGMVQVSIQGAPAISSKIREVVPNADPAAHTFTVKIDVPASVRVVSGMTVGVLFPTGDVTGLSVPQQAIRSRGQIDAVLALDPRSVAEFRYVTVGRTVGDRVEITSGLLPGDRIVMRPEEALVGKRIEAQP